jgi:hypothetical protein
MVMQWPLGCSNIEPISNEGIHSSLNVNGLILKLSTRTLFLDLHMGTHNKVSLDLPYFFISFRKVSRSNSTLCDSSGITIKINPGHVLML